MAIIGKNKFWMQKITNTKRNIKSNIYKIHCLATNEHITSRENKKIVLP